MTHSYNRSGMETVFMFVLPSGNRDPIHSKESSKFVYLQVEIRQTFPIQGNSYRISLNFDELKPAGKSEYVAWNKIC